LVLTLLIKRVLYIKHEQNNDATHKSNPVITKPFANKEYANDNHRQ
jgi:hypothetical protein